MFAQRRDGSHTEYFRYELSTPTEAVVLGTRVHFELVIYPRTALALRCIFLAVAQETYLTLDDGVDARARRVGPQLISGDALKRGYGGMGKYTFKGHIQLPTSLAQCMQTVHVGDRSAHGEQEGMWQIDIIHGLEARIYIDRESHGTQCVRIRFRPVTMISTVRC